MLHIASGAITFWPRSNSTLLQVFQTVLYPPAPFQLSLAALSQLTVRTEHSSDYEGHFLRRGEADEKSLTVRTGLLGSNVPIAMPGYF